MLQKLKMKKILLFTGLITLLTTTGCIVPYNGGHEHAVVVGPPVVVVPAPELVVRPPELIVR
jgi:hypothetical protein